MKWATPIARIAGIRIYIHATFWLLIAWVAIMHWNAGQDLSSVLNSVAFILLLFGCVTFHELGHALAARQFGIGTRDITLLPIGGVARLERMPEKPLQELWVAFAGPLVNVVIAACLGLWLVATQSWEPLASLTVSGGSLVERLLVVNLVLVVFNLLPAFPMDGGRVLRALLALRLRYDQATGVAASIGQGMALLFGLVGLMSNPLLLFIAFFVWIGAGQEANMVKMKHAMEGLPLDRAMLTDFQQLQANDPVERAVDLILAGSQQDFPVVDGDRVVGVLTRSDLLTALAAGRRRETVRTVMEREIEVVTGLESLETAFERFQNGACRTLPVVRNGRLIGLITAENVAEFMMIQSALDRAPA